MKRDLPLHAGSLRSSGIRRKSRTPKSERCSIHCQNTELQYVSQGANKGLELDSIASTVVKALHLKERYNKFSIPTTMSSRAEDGAAQFFFNNYVIDHSVVSSTFFSRLPDLCAKAPADGALMTTISAIGLASFSNTKRAWDIRHQAALKYATAVRSVNAMIKDSAAAQSDELLTVVVLLAFYEEV